MNYLTRAIAVSIAFAAITPTLKSQPYESVDPTLPGTGGPVVFKPANMACGISLNNSLNVAYALPYAAGGAAYKQTVTVQNKTNQTITGAMDLILENLASGVALENRTGLTRCGSNAYVKSYISIPLGRDAALAPGESVQVSLSFTKHPNSSITYSGYVRGGATLKRLPVAGDFDGDGRADLAIMNQQTSNVIVRQSSDMQTITHSGLLGSMPVTADYDGDGKADYAVYSLSTDKRSIRYSSNGTQVVNLGTPNAGKLIPFPADMDGDGQADWIEMLYSEAKMYAEYTVGGFNYYTFGFGPGIVPAPLDYDGDGDADPAMFYQTGVFRIRKNNGTFEDTVFPVDMQHALYPAPADYDGDGKSDPAVFDVTMGTYMVRYSKTGQIVSKFAGFGQPAQADYDGDGRTDFATFNENQGKWTIVYQTGWTATPIFTDGTNQQLVATAYNGKFVKEW